MTTDRPAAPRPSKRFQKAMTSTIKINECCSPAALKMLSDEELATAMANIIAEHESRLKYRKDQAIRVIRGLVIAHKKDFAGDDESQCPVQTEKSLAEGMRRKQYLKAILANNISEQPLNLVEIIKQVAIVIKDPNPPSSATIWRWRNMVEDGGDDLRTLSPAYNLRGRGSRIKSEVAQLCKEAIALAIFDKKLSYRKLHKQIEDLIEERNKGKHTKNRLVTPSNETIRRMLKAARDALVKEEPS